MKPVEMTLCGWGPYHQETHVPFSRLGEGLFLVTGATGAGKTTIFDGIIYALYGKVSTEVRDRESVRSDFCMPTDETYVNLIFTHNNQKYEIRRSPKYMRPKKRGGTEGGLVEEKEKAVLTIYSEDGKNQIVDGPTDVTKAIEDILRLDYKQFKQTTMIAQGEFTRLLFASPKEKTEIFRNLFGTQPYEMFGKRMKSEARALEGEVKILRERMEESVSHLSIEEEAWKALTESEYHNYVLMKNYLVTLAQASQKKLDLLKQEAASCEAREKLLLERYSKAEEIQKRFRELEQARQSLQQLEKASDEIQRQRQELEIAEQVRALVPIKKQLEFFEEQQIQKEKRKKDLQTQIEEKKKAHNSLIVFYETEEIWRKLLLLLSAYGESIDKREELADKKERAKQQHEQKKKLYLQRESEKNQAKEAYRRLVSMRQRAAVGIVLEDLKEGCPCPVCGSIEHPHIGVCTEKIPSEEEIERAGRADEEAQKVFTQIFQEASTLQGQLKQLSEEFATILEEEAQKKEELCKLVAAHTEVLAMFGSSEEEFTRLLPQTAKNILKVRDKWLKYGEESLEKYYRAEKELHGIEERLMDLTEQIVDGKREISKQEKEFMLICQRTLGKKQEMQVYINYIEENKKTEQWISKAQQNIQDYSAKLQSVSDQKKRCEEICSSLDKVDIICLSEQLCQATAQKEEKLNDLQKGQKQLSFYQVAAQSLTEKLAKEEKLQERYGLYQDIASVAEGKNNRHLVFEQYVLAYFFEDILRTANKRFLQMSSGRYYMKRAAQVGDGRSKDSLEIVVHDYYTGKDRSVKTLSGGESFKAALSLALGMSDVIQRMSGGVKVETLFVDEGFGSLDAESLNQACDTLTLLANHTFIGIISHVEELKERIPCQIELKRTDKGSYIV